MIYNLKDFISKKNFFTNFKDTVFDAIIIGSGPSAYIINSKINAKKILVIERGDIFEDYQFNKNVKKSILTNKQYKIKKDSRIYALGGCGNVWGGISSYIEDFEMKSRWSNYKNLWPISHKEITQSYKDIDEKFGFRTKLKLINLKKKNKNLNGLRERKFSAKVDPFKFNDLENYKNSTILLNAKVNYIDEKSNKQFVILDYNQKKIYGKKIILCCGGLETNFLILRSIKNKRLKNIKNKNIIGKYFMEHPKIEIGYAKIVKKNNFLESLALKRTKNTYLYTGLSINKKVQENKKLLNSYVRFEKFSYIDLKNKIKFEMNKKFLNIKYLVLSKYFCKIAILFLFKIFKKDYLIEKYKITLFNEMIPQKVNKISWSNKLKNKQYKVLYKFSKYEFNTIFNLKNELEKLPGINIKYFFKINRKNILKNLKDSSHHLGGTIMGNNYKKSFVDKNLKIHGTKNIFICSTSVFPTAGSVNPTMTLAILALRLCNYLNKSKSKR